MEELIKKISKEVMEELKKVEKPAYPLYYKEVFVNILRDEGILYQINPKLLCLEPNVNEELLNKTSQTIKSIEQASKEIKTESEDLVEKIEPIETDEVKNLITQYSAKLLKQINKMQQKINELEKELDKAYKEILIDPLTKAYNRKAFEKDIENLLKKGNEKNLDIALAIVDFDDFKKINDTYGHLVGDFVLKKIVEIIKKIIGNEHKIYRIGGDEFIIIFYKVDREKVEAIISKLVSIIKRTKLKYKEHIMDVSVSIGVTMHKKGDSKDTIIQRADDALYEAKVTKNTFKVIS